MLLYLFRAELKSLFPINGLPILSLSQKGTSDSVFACQPLTKAPNFGARESLGNGMVGITPDADGAMGEDLYE